MEEVTKPKNPREVLAENDEEDDDMDMDPMEDYAKESVGSNEICDIREKREKVDMPEQLKNLGKFIFECIIKDTEFSYSLCNLDLLLTLRLFNFQKIRIQKASFKLR